MTKKSWYNPKTLIPPSSEQTEIRMTELSKVFLATGLPKKKSSDARAVAVMASSIMLLILRFNADLFVYKIHKQ